MRHGFTACRTFLTLCFLSRYTRSMANFIKKVCTDSQGTIQRPSPRSRPLRFSRPVRRCALESAISMALPNSVLRVRLRMRTLVVDEVQDLLQVFPGLALGVLVVGPQQDTMGGKSPSREYPAT